MKPTTICPASEPRRKKRNNPRDHQNVASVEGIEKKEISTNERYFLTANNYPLRRKNPFREKSFVLALPQFATRLRVNLILPQAYSILRVNEKSDGDSSSTTTLTIATTSAKRDCRRLGRFYPFPSAGPGRNIFHQGKNFFQPSASIDTYHIYIFVN